MTAILEIEGLVKHFGGLVATDAVTLDVQEGEIHALIGPNGAGKSTLINQICGALMPNAGVIRLNGRDVTRAPEPGRIAQGLGRTFQISSLLRDDTVRDNIGMAVQAHAGGNFRIWDRQAARRDIWAETDRLLELNGLTDRAGTRVANLSHGEMKQLELVMALAAQPRLLLLDEPMAGLGHLESQDMIRLLDALRGTCSMLLVEHDMEAVYALADRISVLVSGRIIMTGTADEVRNDARVRDAYLGTGDA